MRASILTAIYDGYDSLKPVMPQEGCDVEWVCVTDDPDLLDHPNAKDWRIIHEPHPGLHPNRAAKHPKMLPARYAHTDRSVWIDASFRVTSPTFVVEALAYADPVAQFIHPWRDCAYEEAAASTGLAKYAGEPIGQQMEAYRREGFPTRFGLWATGVIARHHRPSVLRFGEVWLKEIERWSFQDQLSEAPALWRLGMRPNALPGTYEASPWLAHEYSARHHQG